MCSQKWNSKLHRSGIFVYLYALSAFFSPLALATQVTNEQTLDTILENALQAYGDKQHLASFANNVQFVGTVYTKNDSEHKHAYRFARRAPVWRTDIEDISKDTGSKTEIQATIFDGASYWQINGCGKARKQKGQEKDELPPLITSFKKNDVTVKMLSAEESKWLADQLQHEPYLLTNWQNPAYTFKLLGNSVYKQVPVFAVEMRDSNNTPTLIYLDAHNYLVVAIVFPSWQAGNGAEESKKVTVTKEYSENRSVLGSLWPHKEIMLVNNEPVSTFEFSYILPADDISADYFKIPAIQNADDIKQVRLSAPVTVPFEYCQREIICRGKIGNMEPLWFLIDTGTSDTIIERSVAAQCSLIKGSSFQFSSFRGNLQTQTTNVDRLGLGDLIINDVSAQIADLSSQSKQVGRSIAGIIGMNVLSNYLLTIDYAKPSIQFADAYTGIRPAGLTSISFVHNTPDSTVDSKPAVDTSPPIPKIKVTLPGADAQTFLVDTGAAFNHLSAPVAVKHLKENLDKSTHTIEGTGLDGQAVRLGSIILDPVIVGTYKVHKVNFTYPVEELKDGTSTKSSAPDIGKELGITGILGNPFFEHFLVTIDCPFHRILLKANPQFETHYELEEALNIGDEALFTKRDFRKAEFAYQKALILADNAHDIRYQALAQGRLGNLRRTMAHDLHRPEHIRMAYQHFKQGSELATQGNFKDAQGRILADWSLLYSENGQPVEAQQTIQKAILLAPKDAFVNVDYAVHLFRERVYAEAQKYIEKALFYDPGNWQALWYQIKLSEMFQDTKKEKATLKEIVQRYPWSKVAQDKLRTLDAQSSVEH